MCCRRCVTGPKEGSCAPIAVTVLISSGIIANSVYLVYNLENIALLLLSETTILMGIWTLVLMYLVTFSDPGVVTLRGDELQSMDGHFRNMSLNEEELKVIETDAVFTRALFY